MRFAVPPMIWPTSRLRPTSPAVVWMTFKGNLTQTYAGRPGESLFIALATTIDQFDLPQQPFDELLDAFRQDQHTTRYASSDELFDYCRRSANPVGRIVLRLGDCFDEENAALSDQICTGLQLANFWQDVARDYAIGRIYLPADAMTRFGVSESMLSQSSTPIELRQLLASECDRAESIFRCGLPLADRVPALAFQRHQVIRSWRFGDAGSNPQNRF